MARRVPRFVDKPLRGYPTYLGKGGGEKGGHKYLTRVKNTPNKYNYDIIFKCQCDKHILISYSAYYSLVKLGTIEDHNCGCIEEAYKQQIKSKYHSRNLAKCVGNDKECKSCNSFYSKLSKTGLCSNCKEIRRLGVKLYDAFEDIMTKWDPSCHNEMYKRLPYLCGTSTKGYKVKGFTYIDAYMYEEASKVMWTKSARYVAFSLSKDNMKRLGKYQIPTKSKPKYIKLHRYVLGLGDDTSWVGDHIGGFTLDNRFKNLRVANVHTNSYNSTKVRGNTTSSKYKGVSYRKAYKANPWKVALQRGGDRHHAFLKTEEDAAKHYDNLLRTKYPSEFNKYNFPEGCELSCISK